MLNFRKTVARELSLHKSSPENSPFPMLNFRKTVARELSLHKGSPENSPLSMLNFRKTVARELSLKCSPENFFFPMLNVRKLEPDNSRSLCSISAKVRQRTLPWATLSPTLPSMKNTAPEYGREQSGLYAG